MVKIKEEHASCAQIHSYRSLDKVFGLRFGIWHYANRFYWEKLQKLYGKSAKYFCHSKNCSNFYESDIPLTKILRKHSCVIRIHTGLELSGVKPVYKGSFFNIVKYK